MNFSLPAGSASLPATSIAMLVAGLPQCHNASINSHALFVIELTVTS